MLHCDAQLERTHRVPMVLDFIVRVGGCPASWLSGRALAAQAIGVLGLTPGNGQPFHFPLISPHKIYIY